MLPVARCGDGVRDTGEACDDGNARDGDGCSALCVIEDPLCTSLATCEGGCFVDGTGYAEGAALATNACLTCQPALRADALSPVDDGLDCAGPDACGTVGTCTSGACIISEGCGGLTPICDEGAARCVCSDVSCDDDTYCNGKETCGLGGTCSAGDPVVCDGAAPFCDDGLRTCVACLESRDCPAENPSCLAGVCVACEGCPCPVGEHDGGDGVCVPVTTCSEGFAVSFTDADGDGMGAGVASLDCHPLPFGSGTSTSGSDCDDADETVWTSVTAFPDEDGDGYTAEALDLCVGSTLPDWAREEPSPAPRVSLRAREAVNEPGGGGTETWQNLSSIRELDGFGTFCRPYEDGCRYIVIRRLDLAIPTDVTIRGMVVELIRRAGDDAIGVIFETHVQLAPNGIADGENRADASSSWPFEYTSAAYGGPDDTWGLALTPEMLNDLEFGVAVGVAPTDATIDAAARIDAVRIRVFTDEDRPDCSDSDSTLYALRPLRVDEDGDSYVVPNSLSNVCVGETLPAGRIQHNFGDDCYDSNSDARPGQTAYFGTHRGDGSFDYNCNGVNNKEAIVEHTGCVCDAAGAAVCNASASTSVTPTPACGNAATVDRCAGDCTTCALGGQSFPVLCR